MFTKYLGKQNTGNDQYWYTHSFNLRRKAEISGLIELREEVGMSEEDRDEG